MVILAHRLFHLTRRKEHAGPAPDFEHPVVRDVVVDAMHHDGHGGPGKDNAG
jgi:undecaprenyl-diphosphatase